MLSMPVEKALEWAYREELPKEHGRSERCILPAPWSRSGMLDVISDLGVIIDRSNRFGVVPDYAAAGGAHPAAVALHALVSAIDGIMRLDFGEVDLLDEFIVEAGEGARLVDRASRSAVARAARLGADGKWIAKQSIAELLRRRAILPAWSDAWEVPELSLAYETARADGRRKWYRKSKIAVAWNERGKPAKWDDVEVDGWNAAGKRPYPDAYNRLVLKPDPAEALESRLEWRIWRAALDVLQELSKSTVIEERGKHSSLASFGLQLADSQCPWSPWKARSGVMSTPKILCGLTTKEALSHLKQCTNRTKARRRKSA